MSEGMKQDNAQENPSNAVENKPDSPSNDGLLPEIMAKKEKIKSLEAELAKRDANDEKRRVSKLEQEGKYQEVIAEKNKTIESLNGRLESQTSIVSDYKANLINNLTNDESRKEELATKSVDFLQEEYAQYFQAFSESFQFNINDSSEYSFITLEERTFNTAQTLTGRQGGAVHTVASASDGIQFFMESGNIDVANFKLYGLVK